MMGAMSLSGVVSRLEELDTEDLDVGGLAVALRELARVKGFVAETELRVARRAEALSRAGEGVPASELLERSGNTSPRESRRTARRAEVLGSLPSMSPSIIARSTTSTSGPPTSVRPISTG